jgi:hypothetical protein
MRVDTNTWAVLLTRTVPDVVGSLTACVLAGVAVWLTGRRRGLYLLSLVGFLSGVLVFTNLHVLHDYYAYAIGIFLVAAVGWGVVSLLELEKPLPRAAATVLLGLAVVGSVEHYYHGFYRVQAANRTGMVKLGALVARVTPPDKVVLGFGLDWSSELPFYAERRALIWPSWMAQDPGAPAFQRAIREIGVHRIGSIVLCSFRPDEHTSGRDLPFQPSENVEGWLDEITHRIGFDPQPMYADGYCAVFARQANVVPTGSR